ncbi:hypothetical protein [Dolichospermum compactum]|nr:hypothetical protein [Dolichospermum compactum]
MPIPQNWVIYFLVFPYWLGGNCIANAKPGSFLDAFFFILDGDAHY